MREVKNFFNFLGWLGLVGMVCTFWELTPKQKRSEISEERRSK